MRRMLAAALVLSMMATPAWAESRRRRYARKIVKADLATLGVLTLSAIVEAAVFSPTEKGNKAAAVLAFATVGLYVGGPAYVHLQRDNPRGAMRSATARIGLPAVGAALAFAADNGANFDQIALGTFAGVGAAMILDWTFFARRPAVDVFVAPRGDGAVLGIGGSF
jgi:hypothetical protein